MARTLGLNDKGFAMSTRLKVLSLNLHKGVHYLSRQTRLDDLKAIISSSQADIVFLQEIRGEKRPNGSDGRLRTQFEILADTIWPHYAYGKNAVYQSGHHGNAILSQLPIHQYDNVDVSNHRFERRGILHAQVQVPSRANVLIHLFCVHFDLTEWGRSRQLMRLLSLIQSKTQAADLVVVAGDFNDWRQRASKILEKEAGFFEAHKSLHLDYAKTFPSWWPMAAMDRIYVRNLQVTECQILETKISDHLSLLATLAF